MAWLTPRTTQLQQIDPWALPEGGDMLGPDDGSGGSGYGDLNPQLPAPGGGGPVASAGVVDNPITGMEPDLGTDPRYGSGSTRAAPAGGGADPNVDPFAAMGGGVFINGGWVPANHPAAAGATSTGASSSSSSSSTGVNAPVNGGPSIQQAYSSALQKILTGGNVQQPGQSDAMNAYRAEAARGEAKDRAFLAERTAANGFSGSGGFESGIMGLRQQRRRGEAGFAGQEQQQLREAERQQLMQGLSLALSMGDNEKARELEKMLTLRGQDFSREAALNNNYTANRNTDLGFSNLGYNYASLQNLMNQQALSYLFGGS